MKSVTKITFDFVLMSYLCIFVSYHNFIATKCLKNIASAISDIYTQRRHLIGIITSSWMYWIRKGDARKLSTGKLKKPWISF